MLLIYIYTFLGFYKKKNIYLYIYNCGILLLLLFNFIYSLLYLQNNYFGFNLYKLNYILQYILLNIQFNNIVKYNYFENNNFYFILLYFQFFFLFFYLVYEIIIYKYNILILSNSLFINIIISISEFYGIFAYLNSILFFILIFIKLLQDIIVLNKTLDNNIENNSNKGLITFFYNIVELKNIFTYTISNFNYILNLFTLVNLFSLGIIFYILNELDVYYKIYFYILTVFFILVESICLFIIILILHTKSNLLNKIYDPIFINNFIKKYDVNTFNDNYELQININNLNINNVILFNILEENSTSIDWIILNITLNSKWVDFDLFGIQIHSINSINKIIFMIAIIYKILFT